MRKARRIASRSKFDLATALKALKLVRTIGGGWCHENHGATATVQPEPAEGSRLPSGSRRGATERPADLAHLQAQAQLFRQATERKHSAVRASRASLLTQDNQYSVSKLDAFDRYQSSTSIAQSIAVMLVTPPPCLVITLVLVAIPLDDPTLGWRVNYMFFARSFISSLAFTTSVAYTVQEFIPETLLSWRHLTLVGFCQATVFVGVQLGVSAATGVFTVSFSLLIPVLPVLLTGIAVYYQLARPRIPFVPDFAQRYRRVIAILHVEALPVVVYPVYATVFSQLSSRQQLFFSLLLPAIKAMQRTLMQRRVCAWMDVSGTMLASSHLFHVLFTATCLLNAKSFAAIGVVLAWNLVNLIKSCLKIVYYARKHSALRRSYQSVVPSAKSATANLENVVKRAISLIEQPDVVCVLVKQNPSVLLSSYHRYASPKWIETHQKLLQRQQERRSRTTGRSRSSTRGPADQATAQDIKSAVDWFAKESPWDLAMNHLVSGPSTANLAKLVRPGSHDAKVVRDTLTIFHANEICLLHSYVSGMVYLIYGIYVRVVFHLPNRAFIASTMRVASEYEVENTTTVIYLLYSVEVLTMIVYFAIIRITLGVASMRQLAFVLSSQRWILQSKLITVAIVVFSFQIAHTGSDFTFAFVWLREASNTTSAVSRHGNSTRQ